MASGLNFHLEAVGGERIEAELTLPAEKYSILTGTVTRPDGEPAVQAIVLVLDGDTLQPVGHCLTDAMGMFALGPLHSKQLYYINVYNALSPVRILKIAL